MLRTAVDDVCLKAWKEGGFRADLFIFKEEKIPSRHGELRSDRALRQFLIPRKRRIKNVH